MWDILYISIIGSIVLTIVLLIMTRKPEEEQPFLLVLQVPTTTDTDSVIKEIRKSVARFMLKSKTITPQYEEIMAEIQALPMFSRFSLNLH